MALAPSVRHRSEDWAALNYRLNVDLPVQPRRLRVLPLLLLVALLSSNAVWLQSHLRDGVVLQRLNKQVSELQISVNALQITKSVVHTDTVWRTKYIWKNSTRLLSKTIDTKAAVPVLESAKDSDKAITFEVTRLPDNAPSPPDPVIPMIELPFLNSLFPTLLKSHDHGHLSLKDIIVDQPLEEENPIKSAGQKLTDLLRPKYVKVGANIGWLYAKSPGLMHEGGISYGAEAMVGLSRHWSVTAAYGAGQLHYKADNPAAIFGTPVLPAPPSPDYRITEMDVTGQKIRQFDLGMRYTFSQPGKPRLYFGLGWGGLTILPYTVNYEIQHEPSSTIQKGSIRVDRQTWLRNTVLLSTGLELPLAKRIDLVLAGSFLRPWKKASTMAPDLMGIKGGLNWAF